MKRVANFISVLRMILALSLALTKPLSIVFYLIYFLCGLTDILDGFIARKTNTQSKLGAKLDSIGDFLVIAVLLILLVPVIHLNKFAVIWITLIASLRIITVLIGLIKFRTLALVHSYANKFTGFLLFVVLPVALAFTKTSALYYLICLVASIASIEEFLIILAFSEFSADRKSLFIK